MVHGLLGTVKWNQIIILDLSVQDVKLDFGILFFILLAVFVFTGLLLVAEVLTEVLGLESKRPERETGNGPDNLWGLGDSKFAVIECKSGVTTSEINRDTAAQLMHSAARFLSEYGTEVDVNFVLVHPSRTLAKNASLGKGSRIITPDRLNLLKEHLIGFVTAVSASRLSSRPDDLGERLTEYSLNGSQLVSTHSRSFKR
jgi:hypothetical protein